MLSPREHTSRFFTLGDRQNFRFTSHVCVVAPESGAAFVHLREVGRT